MHRRPYRTGILVAALTALTGFAAGTGTALASPSPTGTAHASARVCAAAPGTAACHALVRTDPAARPAAAAPAGYGPADLQAAYKLPSATAPPGRPAPIADACDDPPAGAHPAPRP